MVRLSGCTCFQELRRLDDSEGVAVFSIDFEAIEKKEQLMKWLAESWGPAVSRQASASKLWLLLRLLRLLLLIRV